ncbi:MAG: non-canonical purine NTP pyrophosphatase [Chloroflexi bacterium]|nr:non-canonical purine NTP pyrophosphatase [Chloroflexota bacterium]MCC6894310.1 xanthosine triphosphate pyrophosphatase [Anaerolineae bacterium]
MHLKPATIHFVTTNKGKADALKQIASHFGIEVVAVESELVEPQADSIIEVAQNKAAQAVKLLGKPVVVEDTGFAIDALAGFPGAYIKYALATIGAEGLIRLVEPFPSTTCRFVSVMCYAEPDGRQHTFIDDSAIGTLAKAIDPTPAPNAWSELWRVFIPMGYSKTLSAMTESERNTLMKEWQAGSVYGQFARWMAGEMNTNVV